MKILDQFRPTPTTFQPTTAAELFALRLAQKLNDAGAVRHYVSLLESCSEDQLLCAYRRTTRESVNGDLGRRFHLELERIWRDARIERIWDGTSEVQRHIISRSLLRPLGG